MIVHLSMETIKAMAICHVTIMARYIDLVLCSRDSPYIATDVKKKVSSSLN